MTKLLLAVVLSMPAAALPGFNVISAPELRTAARPDAAFPSTAGLLGESVDPLATLATGDEDLRDSLTSLPTGEALKAGLRDRSVAVRLDAVRSAAYPRNVRAVPAIAAVMLRLDQPVPLRAAAALALGQIGDRISVPALAEALKDPAPEVRFAAALSLGRLPADGVATRLERTLRSDPLWQPRYAAAIALGRTHKAFVAVSLADALLTDPAWQVRQQAARSLQDIGTLHAAEVLATGLNDPDPSVRAAVGTALGQIGGPDQLEAVANAVDGEPEPLVRAVFVAAARRARPSL